MGCHCHLDISEVTPACHAAVSSNIASSCFKIMFRKGNQVEDDEKKK